MRTESSQTIFDSPFKRESKKNAQLQTKSTNYVKAMFEEDTFIPQNEKERKVMARKTQKLEAREQREKEKRKKRLKKKLYLKTVAKIDFSRNKNIEEKQKKS